MKLFKKFISAVTVFALTAASTAWIMPCMEVSAKAVLEGFKDDFEGYEAQSDITSFKAISSVLATQGRMTPEAGYSWAERYTTDEGEFGEGYGFGPITDPEEEGTLGYLYNYGTSQFYGVSSTQVSNANTKNIVVSGRFCIPDVTQISNFSFSLTPKSHYDGKNLWVHCPLVTVKKNGELYKSVQNAEAAWGASDEKIADVVIESNTWYNVTFMVENSTSRNYKGRLFTDDGTVDIAIEGYLPQLTCAWDTKASVVGLGLVMGKAAASEDANHVFVDDAAIYTTDYGFASSIPTGAAKVAATPTDATTISLNIGTLYSSYDINANTITVKGADESSIAVSSVTANGNDLDVKLASALIPDTEYIVEIAGKGVFMDSIAVSNSFTYKEAVQDLSAKTVFEGYKDNFEDYEAQSDITSFKAIAAGLDKEGRMAPEEGYSWAERYNTDEVEFGEGYGLYPMADPDGNGQYGYLYNYGTSQFYGVSSTQVSDANTRRIVASGRFCIPDVTQISDFSFALTPKSHYGSTNYWPYCPLIKVKKNGELYKSVQDTEATWGASDEKIADVAIESNTWYNVTFLVENSVARKYKGRLFADNGTVDIAIEGYLPQLTCSWDAKASLVGLGLVMGKASASGDANHVFVDNAAIYTTDYSFANTIPTTARTAEVLAKDATTINVIADSPIYTCDINADTIKVSDKNGTQIAVTEVTSGGDGSLDIKLASDLTEDVEYTVEISGKDVFLNEINVTNTVVYKKVKVESVSFTKNQESVTAVSNGKIDCTVNISNPTPTSDNGVLIMALYKGGSLIKTSVAEPILITSGATTALTCSIDCEIEGEASEYTLRAFVWSSEDMITPIVSSVTLGE